MLERDGYPAGVPCFVVTSQPDPEAAARFYGELFGWTAEEQMPPDAPGSYLNSCLDVIARAGWVIDLGPGAGRDGGSIVFEGRPVELAEHPTSVTGRHLALRSSEAVGTVARA